LEGIEITFLVRGWRGWRGWRGFFTRNGSLEEKVNLNRQGAADAADEQDYGESFYAASEGRKENAKVYILMFFAYFCEKRGSSPAGHSRFTSIFFLVSHEYYSSINSARRSTSAGGGAQPNVG
jgi:hypothetical protein